MTPAQLLLRYQALVDRERVLRESIERVQARLVSDPEVVSLEQTLETARERQNAFATRLGDSDKAREDHRSQLRKREKELMSGRIRNPSELMQMSEEVAHMKARFAAEEEDELRLMEEADSADEAVRSAVAELDAARRRSAAEEPDLREQLMAWQTELEEVESERDRVWSEIPQAAQLAYSRVRMRPIVAEVTGNQCSACRVQVTSSGMQLLRKGEVVHCENCGRILVQA